MPCAHCSGPFVGTPVTDGICDPICQACAQKAKDEEVAILNQLFPQLFPAVAPDHAVEGYPDAPEFDHDGDTVCEPTDLHEDAPDQE